MTVHSGKTFSDVSALGSDHFVPNFGFQADRMSPEDNAAAWHEAITTLYEVDELPNGAMGASFRADLVSYALGPAVLGVFRASGQRLRRTLDTVARSGLDHLVVQLYTRGGFDGVAGGRSIKVCAGDVCIIDLAQVIDKCAIDFENVILFVPRPKWAVRFPNPADLHGFVVPGANVAAAIIGRHLQTLTELAPFIARADCDAILEASMSLIAACLRLELEHRDVGIDLENVDLLIRVKQHIDASLACDQLSGEAVAAQFGLSRTALYKLFTPYGGVATYIRTRRLHRAFFDLAMPNVLVRDVAERWHLGSEENFTRAFKAAYGITPRMARTVTLTSHGNAAASSDAVSEFSRWLRNISPPAPTSVGAS